MSRMDLVRLQGRKTTMIPDVDPRVGCHFFGSPPFIHRGTIRFGSTVDNTFGRVGRAVHEALGDRAHQAGRGPHAIADNIISSFGEGSDRVRNLAAVQRELKIQKERPRTSEEQDERKEISKKIDPSALRKQCSEFARYTLSKERSDMQCEAFQRLVQLTTMFPGLRLMLLPERIQSSKLTGLEVKISTLWDRSDSSFLPNEAEWRFWRSFAEMCLSEAPISLMIEICHITQVVQYQLEGTSSCVIDELLLTHRGCDHDTQRALRALCIRYLGQIVALEEFWKQVKAVDPPAMDPHTTVRDLCLMIKETLEDLQPHDTKPLPFDYEGVDSLASTLLKEVIDVLQTVDGIEVNTVSRWETSCRKVVRLLRHEWCNTYLPRSYRLAHSEFFKARMPLKPGTGDTDSAPTETEG
ncbi:hypothetical protein B0H14DRAFT_3151703 [Mycena olivaceomarginata]|nr:hypothetical protein B0H14DRAFT_3151703 [Mycena olivaceomarginata]